MIIKNMLLNINIYGYIGSMQLLLFLLIAMLTLMERQFMATLQRRYGPNIVWIRGIGQPIIDGVKLSMKEITQLGKVMVGLYFISPIISFVCSQLPYTGLLLSDISYLGLFVICSGSLGILGVLIAGWASNNLYSLIGCVRAVSLMISYELVLGCILLYVVKGKYTEEGNKTMNILEWSISISLSNKQYINNLYVELLIYNLQTFILMFICCLAEGKRTPFDLPEAEAELVAGFFVEYGSTPFALFSISEYASLWLMSIFTLMFVLNIQRISAFLCSFIAIIWIRGTEPRYRYDEFLRVGWKNLLPIALTNYIWIVSMA